MGCMLPDTLMLLSLEPKDETLCSDVSNSAAPNRLVVDSVSRLLPQHGIAQLAARDKMMIA